MKHLVVLLLAWHAVGWAASDVAAARGSFENGYARICRDMYRARYCQNRTCTGTLATKGVAVVQSCMRRHGRLPRAAEKQNRPASSGFARIVAKAGPA